MMDFRKGTAMIAATMAVGLFAQASYANDSWHKRHHEPSYGGWHLRGGNFYSDWNSVLHVRGNGTYVVSNGGPVPQPDLYIVKAPVAGVKIIDVMSERNACSYENGVCVIRGTD